eukprot:scaffold19680_cov100-Isochrysis_galbana.AAC.1
MERLMDARMGALKPQGREDHRRLRLLACAASGSHLCANPAAVSPHPTPPPTPRRRLPPSSPLGRAPIATFTPQPPSSSASPAASGSATSSHRGFPPRASSTTL